MEAGKLLILKESLAFKADFEPLKEALQGHKELSSMLLRAFEAQRTAGASADQELGALRERTRVQERKIARLTARLRASDKPGSSPWAIFEPLIRLGTAALFPEATLTAAGARRPEELGRDLYRIGGQQTVEDYAAAMFTGAAKAAEEGQ